MTMVERVARVETEIANLKVSNTSEHQEFKEIIKEFIDSADTKYASKIVERLVYGIVGTILIAFLGAVITLIIN